MKKNSFFLMMSASFFCCGFAVAMDQPILSAKKCSSQISISDEVQNFLQQAIIDKYLVTRTTSVGIDSNKAVQTVVSADGRKMLISVKTHCPAVMLCEDQAKGNGVNFKPISILPCACSCLAISPNGEKVVIVTDMDVMVADVSGNQVLGSNSLVFSEPNNTVKLVKFSEDGNFIAMLNEAGLITVWDIRDIFTAKTVNPVYIVLTKTESSYSDLSIHSNGIIVAKHNNGISLVCYRRDSLQSVSFKHKELGGFVMSPDGKRVVVWNKSGEMLLLKIEDFPNVQSIPMVGHTGIVSSVALSQNNELIVSLAKDGFILWNPCGKPLYTFSTEKEMFDVVAFSNNNKKLLLYGDYLVCYNIDKFFENGDLAKPEFIISTESRSIKLSTLSFSNDDRRIIFLGSPVLITAPFTDEDIALLDKIKECTPSQLQFLHKAFQYSGVMLIDLNDLNSVTLSAFNTLPKDIQEALSDLKPEYFRFLQQFAQQVPTIKEEKSIDIKGETKQLPKKKTKKRDKTKRKLARAQGAQNNQAQQESALSSDPIETQVVQDQSVKQSDDQFFAGVINSAGDIPAQTFAVGSSANVPSGQPKQKRILSVVKEKVESVKKAVVAVVSSEQRQETFLRMGTTYAAAVHPSARRIEESRIKGEMIYLRDTYLEINVPDALQKRDKNPLAQVPYSRHVTETAARETDYFHNFSPGVEKRLGTYVDAEVFENPGRKFCSGTRYTLLANIILPKSEKEISGQLEWVVVKNNKGIEKMTHRFFKPDKSVDKKDTQKNKAPLFLRDAPEKLNTKAIGHS